MDKQVERRIIDQNSDRIEPVMKLYKENEEMINYINSDKICDNTRYDGTAREPVEL